MRHIIPTNVTIVTDWLISNAYCTIIWLSTDRLFTILLAHTKLFIVLNGVPWRAESVRVTDITRRT